MMDGQAKIFLFSTVPRPALVPYRHPIQWMPMALSPGVKRQVREADHSRLSSAEVKNARIIPIFLHMSSWHIV
jgi:hypothetical protein